MVRARRAHRTLPRAQAPCSPPVTRFRARRAHRTLPRAQAPCSPPVTRFRTREGRTACPRPRASFWASGATLQFFMAALGLCRCTWASSSCGKQGLLPLVCGLLTAGAPLAAAPGSRRVHRGCVHRPSCLTACGIFPSQGIPCTGRRILNLWTTREVHVTS